MKCPFCAEEIQNDAIKCRHCNEFIDRDTQRYLSEKKLKWYFRRTFIILAVLSIGPFALPLIWFHPNTTRVGKIALTLGILLLSWYLYQAVMESMHSLQGLMNVM